MAQEIGRAFINFFYQCYDTDRTQLQNIYVEGASLEWVVARLLDADLWGTRIPWNAEHYGKDRCE